MPSMHVPSNAAPADRFDRVTGWLSIIGLTALVIAVLGMASYEVQLYLVVLTAVLLLAIPLIRRAARLEPGISAQFLALALGLKIAASLFRYIIFKEVYGGIGDAVPYHATGAATYEQIRHLDFSFLVPPYTETESIRYLTGFVYAIINPSMPAGFLFYAMLALLGQWWFYRAFTTSFPGGDRRLYGILIFLLPSLLYWPSSLGKDAVMIFSLGLATYGFARALRELSLRPLAAFAIGLTAATIVRPPIGVAIMAAAALAFVLRPSRTRSSFTRALAWLVGVPIVIAVCGFLLINAANSLQIEGAADLFQKFEIDQEGLAKGGSEFDAPDPTNPAGVAAAALTVMFRPFPWEIDNPLVALAGVENLALIGLFLARIRVVLRTIRMWRNGMAIYYTVAAAIITGLLTGFTNFGLLVRQRASLLPFLLVLPVGAVIRKAPKGEPVNGEPATEGTPAFAGRP
jgi:Dolichyl-phosphate-mannose-protein mannosyltransferase